MEIAEREEPPLEWKLAQPHVWVTLRCGVRVQELLPDLYDEVCELIRTQLVPRDTMCKALNMSETDPESVETFVQEALYCMRDGTSIVGVAEEDVFDEEGNPAVDEEGNPIKQERVVAAMVARIEQQREQMEILKRMKIYPGETYLKYIKLINHVVRAADLYTAFNIASYYRIYHITIHEDYKNQGVALFFVKLATLRLTALFNQKICVKLCPDRPLIHLFQRFGFTEYSRIGYEEWLEKGEQIFFRTGIGNYSLVILTYEAGPLGDVNKPMEEIDIEPEPGPPTEFPGRAKTGQVNAANRGQFVKSTPIIESGPLIDYRYLFHRAFEPTLKKENGDADEVKDKEGGEESSKENVDKK